MTYDTRFYSVLCTLFAVLMVIGNATYQKFVSLSLVPLYQFELSVGAILYPLIFLITDIVTELYGKDHARFCVRLALSMNLMVSLILLAMDALPATSWSSVNEGLFHQVFGYYGWAFIASLLACYMAQMLDIRLFLWLRALTGGRHLWLRNGLSTIVSLGIDTAIVISVMDAVGALPPGQHLSLIIDSYCWKILVTLAAIPLCYMAIFLARYYSQPVK